MVQTSWETVLSFVQLKNFNVIDQSCDKKPKMDNSKNHVNKGTNYQKIVQTEPGSADYNDGNKRMTKVTVVNNDHENEELVPPDGGWGWLVLIGSMLVNILVPGTVKSFGVLFVEFLEVFQATPTAAAWIPALCYFLYSSLGPLSSILSVKYSYRTVTLIGGTFAAVGMILSFWAQSVTYLYVSYGLLVGTGAGLAFPPTVYIVTSYFVRLRGLANGLCISGSAIGSIILPPVLRLLLEAYGYRGAVLIMGGVTLNVWVGAMFYHPVEQHMKRVPKIKDDVDNQTEEDKKKEHFYVSTPYHGSTLSALNPEGFASSLTLRSITMNPVTTCCKSGDEEEKVMPNRNKYFDITLLKDPLYLVILISNSTNAISYTNFIILLPSYAVLLGFDKSMAAWLISIVSALDLVGRIGGSALSDTELLPKQWYFIGGLLISGISLAALPTASTYVMLSVYCGIFGLASGVYVGVTAVIMADMLGTERLTSTYGISLFVNGILQLIGPPLCGVWFEQSHTYVPLFTTLGIVLIIGASIWIFVPFIKKRQQQELVDEEIRS
ncbi:hermes [Carabus blaptoides fortunei]